MNPHTAPAALAVNGTHSLIGDRLHRLGANIILDEQVSWCPQGVRVTQPVNCYLIKGSAGSVLVDTGIRLHEAEIIRQLESLLDPGERLDVVLTRTEMECCLNLPAIEARFDVESVWYTGGITVPRTSATPRRIMVNPGTSLEVEVMDGLILEFVSPLMRLLPTLWIFDPVSKALLTSDAFTHGSYGSSKAAAGLHKFQWFAEADTRGIARDVEEAIRERHVKAIGPGYGEPFVGPAESAAEATALAEAIRKVGIQ
ncbi:MBL fold metallo-hydrolase [Arthrobacter sp. NPDC058130]|uniref:MBL fold metallo-hydrolase n=1 Tax=Arthrobacter sp. NPDC058130 TaxID=3346353 RepID=UPI0036E66E88